MSTLVDADFPAAERARMLAAIRSHLPAFLHRGAGVQHDPAGDVRELLNLEERDLRRVVAVHQCLDRDVLAFGESLGSGLRHPHASSIRPPEVSQGVRGPVDWSATVARRALAGGDSSLFVTRPARRVFDTTENRALAWLLDGLRSSTRIALRGMSLASSEVAEEKDWAARIGKLSDQVQAARRVKWLQGIEPELPTADTISRLKASRRAFYAHKVARAVEVMLALTSPSGETLAAALSKRYFEPAPNWLIFEVYVALSLARAFAKASGRPRKGRLLVGAGRGAFARYAYADGSEVALIYQGWPDDAGRSLRREVGARHAMRQKESKPDLFIVRSGPHPDAAIIECKASFDPGYLDSGLVQLLGYLADRPEAWKRDPSGWLVAPSSRAFVDRPADGGSSLWVLSVDRVAKAAVERFVLQ